MYVLIYSLLLFVLSYFSLFLILIKFRHIQAKSTTKPTSFPDRLDQKNIRLGIYCKHLGGCVLEPPTFQLQNVFFRPKNTILSLYPTPRIILTSWVVQLKHLL